MEIETIDCFVNLTCGGDLMPIINMAQLPKSRSAEEFELLCGEYLRERYKINAQQYGRNGQSQNGIDIFAPSLTQRGFYDVAQCKNYFRASSANELIKKIASDIDAASKQTTITISKFYVMISLDRDLNVQNFVIGISPNYKFDIEVLFWEDIQVMVLESEYLLSKYYSYFFYPPKNFLELFNLAFFGMQFTYLIFLLLGDRSETNKYCNFVEQGAGWITNLNSRLRFNLLVNEVRQFVNGDLPFQSMQQWQIQSEYSWCKEIESITSMLCDSLMNQERLYFMLGAKLSCYNQLLDSENDPLPTISESEKSEFISICNTLQFTKDQVDKISQMFDVMMIASNGNQLSVENYTINAKKMNAPIMLYEFIRKSLLLL